MRPLERGDSSEERFCELSNNRRARETTKSRAAEAKEWGRRRQEGMPLMELVISLRQRLTSCCVISQLCGHPFLHTPHGQLLCGLDSVSVYASGIMKLWERSLLTRELSSRVLEARGKKREAEKRGCELQVTPSGSFSTSLLDSHIKSTICLSSESPFAEAALLRSSSSEFSDLSVILRATHSTRDETENQKLRE